MTDARMVETTDPAKEPSGSVPPAPTLGTRRKGNAGTTVAERFGLLGLLIVVIVVFSILAPRTFPTLANAQNIVSSQSVLAVIGLALIVPLVGGRFDVSVGGNLGISAIVCAGLMSHQHLPLPLAIVLTLVLGAVIGIVNGFVVAYLGVNSIIATIGTGTILGGVVQAMTNGIPISSGLSPVLTDLSFQKIVGVPLLFLIMAVIAVIVWFVLSHTPFGRRLLATGSNESAAYLVGVPTRRIVLLSFISAGVLASLAGILQVAVQGSGDPNAGGLPFILPALAAVFLGATNWKPGTYNVGGMLIGLLFVSTTISGLVLIGVRPWVTDVLNGAVVVIAIIISAQIRRRRTGALEIGG